jgi:hypothetical protein
MFFRHISLEHAIRSRRPVPGRAVQPNPLRTVKTLVLLRPGNTGFRLLLLVLGLFAGDVFAQDEIDLNATDHCLYHGERMPSSYVRFESDPEIEGLKDLILEKIGTPANFEMLCSNVPSIAAVVDRDKRYILYSRRFFNTEPDRVVRLALIAHEIGHHANGHALTADPTAAEEEIEADEFMGYALCLTGAPAGKIEGILTRLALHSGVSATERLEDVMRGFNRAEASLRNAEHASWFEEHINEVVSTFPQFPLPVPEPSAQADLRSSFAGSTTMSDVDRKLRRALDAAGYATRRYLYVPDGFAIVTRMEQFNANGTCKSEASRWSSKVARCENFTTSCYQKTLSTVEPGLFRVFVFVVTPRTIRSMQPPPTRSEATAWLNEAASQLPEEIARLAFDARTNVVALVYEYKLPVANGQPERSVRSALSGTDHLTKGRILEGLRRP